jgi:glycosyltransferase involved in cell wall biosynthesis
VSFPERVLMINKFHYPRGGAELYMLRVAELLEREGAEVLYFASRHKQNLPSATDRFFPSEVDFGAPGRGVPRLRAAGRAVYSIEARRKLAALLEAEPVDIAHLHNVYHHLSPSILAPLRDRGIPVVMTVHDYKLVCPVYTLLSNGEVCERCVGGHLGNAVIHRCNRESVTGSLLVAGESWLHRRLNLYLRGIDLFVTPSRFLRDKLVAGGYPETRIRYVPNFVDATGFAPAYEPGSYALFSGRLAPEKGVDVLLRAAAAADIPLKVAGDGPERLKLEALASDLGSDVEFLGHLGFDALAQHVAGSFAVVVPSRWHENCPLAVLEAMAWGKPVVGTTLGGMPELVEHGKQGVLVPPDDASALAAALSDLRSAPEWVKEMGAEGRRKVESSYSPTEHIAALRDVYSEAAERKRGALVA